MAAYFAKENNEIAKWSLSLAGVFKALTAGCNLGRASTLYGAILLYLADTD